MLLKGAGLGLDYPQRLCSASSLPLDLPWFAVTGLCWSLSLRLNTPKLWWYATPLLINGGTPL